jgi:hypothetical protein
VRCASVALRVHPEALEEWLAASAVGGGSSAEALGRRRSVEAGASASPEGGGLPWRCYVEDLRKRRRTAANVANAPAESRPTMFVVVQVRQTLQQAGAMGA